MDNTVRTCACGAWINEMLSETVENVDSSETKRERQKNKKKSPGFQPNMLNTL